MNKHTVAVVGASGYSGLELTRILARHPACPTALRGFAAVKRLKSVRGRLDEVATIARSPRAELLVAGRSSSATLRNSTGSISRVRRYCRR